MVFSHIFKSFDGSLLLPARPNQMLVVLASVIACGVGLAAAVIPARSAARVDSVQEIRD